MSIASCAGVSGASIHDLMPVKLHDISIVLCYYVVLVKMGILLIFHHEIFMSSQSGQLW
jgi:hypothetical protein